MRKFEAIKDFKQANIKQGDIITFDNANEIFNNLVLANKSDLIPVFYDCLQVIKLKDLYKYN